MSTISNKFFIQVIEDGTTLRGELRATKSLTQAYKDGVCIPEWGASGASARPLIYLSLMNGSTLTAPDSGYKWLYNGTEITFSSTSATYSIGGTNYTGRIDTSHGGIFVATTYNLTVGSQKVAMPALGIIGNLATSDNVDVDVISFLGSKTLSTNPVDFGASVNVTITEWIQGGYLGVIEFANGVADLSEDNSSVTAKAILYNENGQVTSGVTYNWYLNDVAKGSGNANSITITDADVVDYAVLRCDFKYNLGNVLTQVATAYVGIDDTHDPEYLYIQYNGATGNSASLRDGESVTFSMWVGHADDTAVLPEWKAATFKVKILDSQGDTVFDTTSGTSIFGSRLAAADSQGYRVMTRNASTGVATVQLTYNDVYTYCKKGLTGIVLVEV